MSINIPDRRTQPPHQSILDEFIQQQGRHQLAIRAYIDTESLVGTERPHLIDNSAVDILV